MPNAAPPAEALAPALDDGVWLRAAYCDQGLNLAQIAVLVGCSVSTVHAAVARHGIPTRGRGRRQQQAQPPGLDDLGLLRDLYEVQRRGAPSIAAEIGCTIKQVYAALERHNIPVRPKRRRNGGAAGAGAAAAPGGLLDDVPWLRNRYEQGLTMQQIADLAGVDRLDVREAVRRHALPDRPRPGTLRYPQLGDPAWLQDHFLVQRLPFARIAALVGCSPVAVRRALARHGLLGLDEARDRQPLHVLLRDGAWLRARYESERLPVEDIAALVGCDRRSISRAIKRHGIPVRER